MFRMTTVPRFAAFLRGVSPMNAKMPQLKAAFEAAGFTEVKTVQRLHPKPQRRGLHDADRKDFRQGRDHADVGHRCEGRTLTDAARGHRIRPSGLGSKQAGRRNDCCDFWCAFSWRLRLSRSVRRDCESWCHGAH